jgi:hypothetical protein
MVIFNRYVKLPGYYWPVSSSQSPRVLHLDGELQLPQMSFRALLRWVAHVAGPGRQQPLHRGLIGLAATVSMEPTEKLYPICSMYGI